MIVYYLNSGGIHKKLQFKSLVLDPGELANYGFIRRVLLPASVLLCVYLLKLQWLWLAYGDIDNGALDWAVVLILLGVLDIGPEAGLIAGSVATVVRAVVLLSNDADLLMRHSLEDNLLLGLSPGLWVQESWLFLEPGVVIVPVSVLLASLVFWYWRLRKDQDYPVWIGVPLALGVQIAFVIFADMQWGREATAVYFRQEALPAVFGLALTVTALALLVRANRLEYARRQTQLAELESARHQLQILNAPINPNFLNNALSVIGGLMIRSPEKAQALLGNLGDYFRDICDQPQSLVTLENDMLVTNRYVQIQKARLAERLQVQWDVGNDCLRLTPLAWV